MIRIKKVKSLTSAFVLTLLLSGAAFTAGTLADDEPPAPEPQAPGCTSVEGVPCTQMCGPSKVGEFTAGGVHYIEMYQSRQMNLLTATSTDFKAPCIPGYYAVSGVYNILPEETNIDLDEIKMNQRAHNDMANNTGAWVVSIYRAPSLNVDNCVNVEVRAMCVK